MKIHIDIDSFFASALRVFDPTLEKKPLAVAGRSDTKIFSNDAKEQVVDFSNQGSFVPTFYKLYNDRDDDLSSYMDERGRIRGIITTASYEARTYGVKTAMRLEEALKLCPNLIIKAPNMALFSRLSHELRLFLEKEIPLIEQASIDEFYGDLRGWVADEDVWEFIDLLRHRIKRYLRLPVSIGAAPTRYIAKLATSDAKPFGSKVIMKDEVFEYIKDKSIYDFPGIGRRFGAKLESAGITKLGDILKRHDRLSAFGPYGEEIYKRVALFKDDPIQSYKERKSIGISRTIDPLYDRVELARRVQILARHLAFGVEKLGVYPTTYAFSLRYEMGKKSAVRRSLRALFHESFFRSLCLEMLHEADIYKRLHVIRISIHCGGFTKNSKRELDITTFHESLEQKRLSDSLFASRKKYGLDILKWGSEL